MDTIGVMHCKICEKSRPYTPVGHHDHLADFALSELKRLFSLYPHMHPQQHLGWRNGQLQQSPALQNLLRFIGKERCCPPCNNLEGAWKIGSNKGKDGGGFLPADFSLTPGEIADVQAIGAPDNKDERVKSALKKIWDVEENRHSNRKQAITNEVKLFFHSLPQTTKLRKKPWVYLGNISIPPSQ